MRVVIGVFVFRVLNSMKCDRLLSELIVVTTIIFSLFFYLYNECF
jgi:hypothetical protein